MNMNEYLWSEIMLLIGPILGLLFCVFVLNKIVKRLVGKKTKEKIILTGNFQNTTIENRWKKVIEFDPEEISEILGRLECAFFYLSIFFGEYILVGGWLALKVAAKWQVWQQIIQVPNKIDKNTDVLEYLKARYVWGTRMLYSFLIGTLANILAAFAGIFISKIITSLIKHCYSIY